MAVSGKPRHAELIDRVPRAGAGVAIPSPSTGSGAGRGGQGIGSRMTRRAVDVCFTPREIRPADLAVVVDVLRATSTIVQALAAGYRRVLCCGSPATARGLRSDGRVLAGERNCVRLPDFELGNSPAAMAPAERPGRELVLATTNGSPAIVAASSAAGQVLIGCLLNLGAVLDAIGPDTAVTIVCSGTDGSPALEDVYAAGRLVAGLDGTRSDAARVAERVASAYPTPLEPLAQSEDAARLRATGQEADIAWCARESALEVVPQVCSTADGLAVVENRTHRCRSMADDQESAGSL